MTPEQLTSKMNEMTWGRHLYGGRLRGLSWELRTRGQRDPRHPTTGKTLPGYRATLALPAYAVTHLMGPARDHEGWIHLCGFKVEAEAFDQDHWLLGAYLPDQDPNRAAAVTAGWLYCVAALLQKESPWRSPSRS